MYGKKGGGKERKRERKNERTNKQTKKEHKKTRGRTNTGKKREEQKRRLKYVRFPALIPIIPKIYIGTHGKTNLSCTNIYLVPTNPLLDLG